MDETTDISEKENHLLRSCLTKMDGIKMLRISAPPFSRDGLHSEPLFSDMLHKVGHDIGNPLTAIVSIAALIERFPQDPSQITPEFLDRTQRYGASIGEEAWRIASLSEKLVMLLSEREPNFDSANIRQAIDRALSKIKSRTKDKRINISFRQNNRIAPALTIQQVAEITVPTSVIADFDQLVVIFTEVIANAYHTFKLEDQNPSLNNLLPVAPPPVECSIEALGNDISICFSNPIRTPIKGELTQLFLPGTTGYTDSKHTGLGLSMIWSVIERMGGSVNIAEGQTGEGEHRFFTEIVLPSA